MNKVLLLAIALNGLQAAAATDASTPGNSGSYSYVLGQTLEFHPFELGDFVNPATGRPYQSNEPVTVQIGSTAKVYSSATDFLQSLNDTEKELNRLGKSLRQGGARIDAHTMQNPAVIVGQLAATLGMNAEKLSLLKEAITNCDLVKLEDFNLDARVSLPFGASSTISLQDKKPVLVQDFIGKVNQQQQLLCQIGYSFIDRSLAGGQHFVDSLLDQRAAVMTDLGISRWHPIFDFSVPVALKDAAEIAQTANAIAADLQQPTPAHLYDLARKVTVPLPPELQLPDIPNIPSPTVPKRPDLKLKKEKIWDFSEGSNATMSAYAHAYLQVNGNETSEEIRSQAKTGFFLLDREINIGEAHGYMYGGQTGVHAEAHASVIGVDLYQKTYDDEVSHTWGNDREVDCVLGDQGARRSEGCDFSVPIPLEYTQQFFIGPVPAFVTVGVKGEVGLGWSAGLTLLSATAAIKPFAEATAYGIAAAGLKDIIEAGVKGEITVIDDTIVVQGDAGIKFDGDGVPKLDMSLTGYNTYTLLAGRVYAYIKADAMSAVAALYPGAVQLVNSAADAAEKAEAAASAAVNRAGNAVAKICGWRSPIYYGLAEAGVGYFNLNDLERALTYYQEFDIYGSHGWSAVNARFLNYHIVISPFGTTLDGDTVDNTDRDEAKHLNDVLTLEQQEATLAKLTNDTAEKETMLYKALNADLTGDQAVQVAGDPALFKAAATALDSDRDAYLARLDVWVKRST